MSNIDSTAMFKLSYGLFVLSTCRNGVQMGCIINTATQLTSTPLRISIAVNKQNMTHDMVKANGFFNISVLTESTPFELIQRFGFRSGRDGNKLDDFYDYSTSENGAFYLTAHANAFISAEVIETVDCGTHTLFIADVTESKVLNTEPSATYDYYFKHIKPPPDTGKKKGYVCKICGYVYEGDVLPDDFICPLCKHGAEDFEPLK